MKSEEDTGSMSGRTSQAMLMSLDSGRQWSPMGARMTVRMVRKREKMEKQGNSGSKITNTEEALLFFLLQATAGLDRGQMRMTRTPSSFVYTTHHH